MPGHESRFSESDGLKWAKGEYILITSLNKPAYLNNLVQLSHSSHAIKTTIKINWFLQIK